MSISRHIYKPRVRVAGEPCPYCGTIFYGHHCLVCRSLYNKEIRKLKKTPPRDPEYARKWNIKNQEKVRNDRFMLTFGITLDDYNDMYTSQNGCCALCGKHQVEFKRRLAIDHDHKTGEIRGLLCLSCNTHLGVYELHKEEFESYLNNFQKDKP